MLGWIGQLSIDREPSLFQGLFQASQAVVNGDVGFASIASVVVSAAYPFLLADYGRCTSRAAFHSLHTVGLVFILAGHMYQTDFGIGISMSGVLAHHRLRLFNSCHLQLAIHGPVVSSSAALHSIGPEAEGNLTRWFVLGGLWTFVAGVALGPWWYLRRVSLRRPVSHGYGPNGLTACAVWEAASMDEWLFNGGPYQLRTGNWQLYAEHPDRLPHVFEEVKSVGDVRRVSHPTLRPSTILGSKYLMRSPSGEIILGGETMRFWDLRAPWIEPCRSPSGLDVRKLKSNIQPWLQR